MGYYYENAVIKGLCGVKLEKSVPGRKGGKPRVMEFGAEELAFLAVIANLQANPEERSGLDPIVYCAASALQEYTHISRSRFFMARNLLVELGLLDFRPQDGRYSNVYRISLKGIRAQRPDITDAEWEKMLLGAPSKAKLSAAQRRVLLLDEDERTVHQEDSPVHQMDSRVHQVDSTVHQVDTKRIKKETTKQQHGVVGGFDERRDWNQAKPVLVMAAGACGVNPRQITQSCLWKVCRGRTMDELKARFAEFGATVEANGWLQGETAGRRIARMIAYLKQSAPGSPEAALAAKAEADMFRPVRTTPQPLSMAKRIDRAWRTICDGMEFEKLEEGKRENLRQLLFNKYRESDQAHLDVLLGDLLYKYGNSYDVLRQNADMKTRVEHFKYEVEDHVV